MITKETIKLTKQTFAVLLTFLIFATLTLAAWQLRNLVFLIFSAYLLMLALQRPARLLIKITRLPRSAAVFVSYIILFVFVSLLLAMTIPPLHEQLLGLIQFTGNWLTGLGILEELSRFNFTLAELSDLFNRVSSSFSAIFSLIGSTFNIFINAILLFVISIHFSLEHEDFYKKIYWFTRNEHRVHKVQKFILILERDLGGWVIGQAALMFIIGLLTFVVLALLQVPFALPLGILAGILEIIPNIGPIAAAIPAILIAFFAPGGSVILGVTTLVFTFVIQQLENMFIVPFIMKNTANVNPLISIILVVAGAQLFGFIGALLAIPAYITVRTTYSFWWHGKILPPSKTLGLFE